MVDVAFTSSVSPFIQTETLRFSSYAIYLYLHHLITEKVSHPGDLFYLLEAESMLDISRCKGQKHSDISTNKLMEKSRKLG